MDLAYSSPRSFSQFGEDRFLLRHFADCPPGFYVDVGAYHPFYCSNTHLLYRRGWHGINLEPDSEAFALFGRHRSRDINLPIAVCDTNGIATFARSGSFAGIVDDKHLWNDMSGERITVRTSRLDALLAEYVPAGTQVDLLDVDCEGHDLDVLRSNDWERFRPSVVLAEAHGQDAREEIEAYLQDRCYKLATQLDMTLAFVPLKWLLHHLTRVIWEPPTEVRVGPVIRCAAAPSIDGTSHQHRRPPLPTKTGSPPGLFLSCGIPRVAAAPAAGVSVGSRTPLRLLL